MITLTEDWNDRVVWDNFVEGHELPAEVARWVPAGMVGRLLTAAEAERILDAMEG